MSQRDIMCAKIRKIINNSADDYSIPLTFCTDFDHVTFDVLRTFKATGSRIRSQRDMTYQHKKRYISGTDKLSKVKLGENYSRAKRHTSNMFKVIRSNTEIAITPPRIARLRSNLVQSFTTSQRYSVQGQWSKMKVQGHRISGQCHIVK